MTQQHFETQPEAAAEQIDTGQIVERLSRFEGPPEQFIQALLALQCRLAGAEQGALLRIEGPGRARPLAVHPRCESENQPAWLAIAIDAAPRLAEAQKPACLPVHDSQSLYGDPPRASCILLPIRRPGQATGVAAFLVQSTDQTVLAERCGRLELSAALLQLYEMRVALQRRQSQFTQLRQSVEILSAVNAHSRFLPSAMALCNEIAKRFDAQRVAVGLLKGRYVRVRAMSETEKIDRKTEDVQRIEAAMEEALDQDIEVLVPSDQEACVINRSARELARHGSVSAVVSLPLRREGELVGVLTCQRDPEKPFSPEEVALLRLTCEMCTARIVELSRTDRWIGARLAAGLGKGAAAAVGTRHTWLKLLALGVAGLLAFAFLARGTRTAEGNFTIQARRHTELAAPFDDRLIAVYVKPGDQVTAGQLLAELRTDRIAADLAQARRDEAIARRKYSAYLDAAERSEARIALLEAEQAQQRIQLHTALRADARITAPVDGEIIQGDWQRFDAPPVQRGQTLFVIAPAEQFEAELLIAEDRIVGVCPGSEGELAATGRPDEKIPFTVEWVSPVAELVGQDNVYRVRVRLARQPNWLRHGIEGVAKVHLGRASYAEIWTAPVVNWVRMKLWW